MEIQNIKKKEKLATLGEAEGLISSSKTMLHTWPQVAQLKKQPSQDFEKHCIG